MSRSKHHPSKARLAHARALLSQLPRRARHSAPPAEVTPQARRKVTLPYFRIEDPNSKRSINFQSEPASFGAGPKISPVLVPHDHASVFDTREIAQTWYDKFLQGEALDIVRVDA